ncbi:hypothetical protein Tco_0471474, partial [Tanacetum coccineum]
MVPPNNLGPDLNGKSISRNLREAYLIAVFREFSGACQLLGGKLVCWSAKKQQSIAMSSAEAEFVLVAGGFYKTKSAGDGLKTAHTTSGANEESRADDISQKVKLEDLSNILKDARSTFFTPDSTTDEPIIVSYESEEEENAEKDKDTEDTSSQKEELEKAKLKAEAETKPLYPDINQLTELLVTSLKHELSKLLASHDFASCLPTELKELPSKIIGLSREIKELKQHIKDMEIKLPGDLIEIPTKLESFTSTISSLSSQVAELKNIQWKPPAEFLNLSISDTLNSFSTVMENASGVASINVPSASQAPLLLDEGEKNTKDACTNLKNDLIDILGKDVVTQY